MSQHTDTTSNEEAEPQGSAWWRWTKRGLWGLGGMVAAVIVAFGVAYAMIDVPDPNADFQTENTMVYYADGETELGMFQTQNRDSVPLTEMSSHMRDAVIAAEDRSFYDNRGIDVRGILRAATNNITEDSTQGASTITQQYVKILYLTQEQTYTRKLKEAIIALKVDRQLTKDEILEGYLNTIYFGNGAYGVETASQTYFNKAAVDLEIDESAVLAAILNSPGSYDPYDEDGADRLIPRYNYVLRSMVETGAISEPEAAEYVDELPEFHDRQPSDRFGGPKGHTLRAVERELLELGFTGEQINGGGLEITTTFDAQMQQAAVDAVSESQPDGLDELNVGLVSVEVGTGAVRAMYGGPDYVEDSRNWAMLGTQPGSTFKVFGVIAGLRDGFSLQTQLDGNSPIQRQGASIRNQGDSGGQSFGRVSLRTATERSINTAFIDLTDQMTDGPELIKQAAIDAGMRPEVIDPIDPVLVTSLGFAPVPPVDIANAYATLAAEGERADYYMVESVTDSQGSVLFEREIETEQAISEAVAADTVDALRGVVTRGTGTSAATVCVTGGKTGTATADDPSTGETRVSSSWYVGMSPKLATAVVYNRGENGNGQLDGYLQPFFGGSFPAQTFRNFMNSALDPADCGEFAGPAGLDSSRGTDYVPPPPSPSPTPTEEEEEPEPSPSPSPTPSPSPSPTASPTEDDDDDQGDGDADDDAGGGDDGGELFNGQ